MTFFTADAYAKTRTSDIEPWLLAREGCDVDGTFVYSLVSVRHYVALMSHNTSVSEAFQIVKVGWPPSAKYQCSLSHTSCLL